LDTVVGFSLLSHHEHGPGAALHPGTVHSLLTKQTNHF
jgi:hypothetical protein